MQLWNDYEGRTVAEAYPLGKLLRPEGRSAFFSTSNGTGNPSIIRIIEGHFDESEILSRWKVVSDMAQPNLITMRKFGETVLDGTPLVYAVMEPTEADLSDVLRQRHLTVDETRELATSLVSALESLHAHNLVHEHVDPENIHAVGETIKLRSDCIREAGAGLDGNSSEIEARKSRDVHDLAVVLLQALTGHRELKGSATLLPTPFDAIIRNGLSGTWGLKQMATALAPRTQANPAEAAPTRQPEKAAVRAMPQSAAPAPMRMPPAAQPQPQPAPAEKPSPKPVTQATSIPQPKPIPAEPVPAAQPRPTASAAQPRPTASIAPNVRDRIVRPVVEPDQRRKNLLIAGAAGALILLLLLWHFLRTPEPNPHPITTLATPTPQQTATPAPTAKPSATHTTAKPAPATAPVTSPATTSAATPVTAHKQWRVIAYTYNREDQAKQKATSVASRNPALKPEVFSPSGHAPYLISLGGPMSRDEATAMRNKALAAGFPNDTYIQNYTR